MPPRDLQAQVDDLAHAVEELNALVVVLRQQVSELKAREALRSGAVERERALHSGFAMLYGAMPQGEAH